MKNQRISISLLDAKTEQFKLSASCNISSQILDYNEIFIKTWAENKGLLELLQINNIISHPHRWISCEHLNKKDIPVCYLENNIVILNNLTSKKYYNINTKLI